ncbi:hypothetical protein HMPREF1544_08828 [Mucor circinelloides 1006PhL]|uniref:Choice-of-anchor A domain-containing protein n=1 Tax=Mucor circinelloides f. circinelloides (strain 1006PhL) TaxID=1220926 RepID=S2J2Y8_MUCC1|nr:hypothetical protein HMPREF1544_08828 [Mucor circinelloides 1006PhL]
MKNQLLNVSLILAAWALGVNAAPAASVEDVCSLLTSLSAEGKMLTKFNGVFFGDFTSGKNGGSQGPLAVAGSFIGQDAIVNQRNQATCASETSDSLFGHHGLILKGDSHNSTIRVNGFANVLKKANIVTPLKECSVKETATEFDFEKTRMNALGMSEHMASMLPNWNINNMGVIVNIVAEGVDIKQPFNLFSMPVACNHATCEAKNYFNCARDHACQVPEAALSDVQAMLLGNGTWTGPVEQVFPSNKMIVFNIPVLDGETFDIKTRNPSAGLNACNTIYNFYAVNPQGVYIPSGKFTLKRSSHESLAGMVLAPQAHIIDTFYGSFSGQIIADSYEAHDSGVQIKDYLFSGNDKCQAFAGCSASAASAASPAAATVASTPSSAQKKKLVRRQEVTADTETMTDATTTTDIVDATPEPSIVTTTEIVVGGRDPWHRHKIKHWIHQWDSGKKGGKGGDDKDQDENEDMDEEEKNEWKEKGVDPDQHDKDFDFGGKKPHKKPAHRFDYYYEDEEEEHF